MEQRFGQEVLSDMVNQEVIKQAASEYGISVSEEELDTELMMIKAKYGSYDEQYLWYGNDWEDQIEQKILLEKLLVQSIEIPENKVEEVYNVNEDLYEIDKTYHLSHIIVEDKKTAQAIYKQLQDGVAFGTLALEQSTDTGSAYQAGDIGYINKNQTRYSPSYYKQAGKLKEEEFSKPFKVEDGYALIFVQEIIKAKTFTYKDVKSMIERELALEEIDGAIAASYFWDELGVKWNY